MNAIGLSVNSDPDPDPGPDPDCDPARSSDSLQKGHNERHRFVIDLSTKVAES
jgi:hypothetical protein